MSTIFTISYTLLEVHFHTAQQQSNFKPYVGQNWCEKLREAELDVQSYSMKIFFSLVSSNGKFSTSKIC